MPHICVVSSQVMVVHCSSSMPQVFCGPPVHTPPTQLSFTVQKSSSSHSPPSAGTTVQTLIGPGS